MPCFRRNHLREGGPGVAGYEMADGGLVQLFGGIEDGDQFGDGAICAADIFGGQVREGAKRRTYWLAAHGDRVHEDAGAGNGAGEIGENHVFAGRDETAELFERCGTVLEKEVSGGRKGNALLYRRGQRSIGTTAHYVDIQTGITDFRMGNELQDALIWKDIAPDKDAVGRHVGCGDIGRGHGMADAFHLGGVAAEIGNQ